MPTKPSTELSPTPLAMQAVLYVRVDSSHHHGDWSGQRQLNSCYRWAEKYHLDVAQEFIDLGYRGMKPDRPMLNRLFDYLQNHPVGYVVCEEMTTLAQDYPDSINAVMRIQHHGAKVAIAALDAVLEIHRGELPGGQPEDQETARC